MICMNCSRDNCLTKQLVKDVYFNPRNQENFWWLTVAFYMNNLFAVSECPAFITAFFSNDTFFIGFLEYNHTAHWCIQDSWIFAFFAICDDWILKTTDFSSEVLHQSKEHEQHKQQLLPGLLNPWNRWFGSSSRWNTCGSTLLDRRFYCPAINAFDLDFVSSILMLVSVFALRLQ